MPQKPAGPRWEARFCVPIPRRGVTGRRGGGVAIPDQREGGRVNTLPRGKCGELRDLEDGVRWEVIVGLVKVSDSVSMVVMGIELEANESPCA